jgi:kynurenine formamidase
MRLVDLSLTIEPEAHEPVPVEVERVTHREGADILGRSHAIGHSQFPGGLGLSLEHLKLTSHTGTHVDAPLHYGPLCEGRPARPIDELPLEWFFNPGVLLSCPGTAQDGPVRVDEVRGQLREIGHRLAPEEIVLIHTGADRLWRSPAYFSDFRGLSREATVWLLDCGVKVIGIDSFGLDPPFDQMLSRYRATGDAGHLWPCHVYGRDREYCQIERLANLDAIGRPRGFRVACFPIKLGGCGAAWSRVVALLDG